MKVLFKNQLNTNIQLSAGMTEYNLNPEQEVELNLQDGDCMYIDQLSMGNADDSLLATIHNFLTMTPCVVRSRHDDACSDCAITDSCDWYKTMVDIASRLK